MPAGDRTGPRGIGQMTGRGVGYCAGLGAPGFANAMGSRGAGKGGRHGRHCCGSATGQAGRGRFGFATTQSRPLFDQSMTKERKAELLKNQAEALQSELDAVQKRLEEIGTEQ